MLKELLGMSVGAEPSSVGVCTNGYDVEMLVHTVVGDISASEPEAWICE